LIAGLAVALCSCAASADTTATTGHDAAGATSSTSSGATPATTTPSGTSPDEQGAASGTATGSVHAVTTVLLTDDPAPSERGSTTWPDALADRAARSGTPLALEVTATEGAGFASVAPGGVSFTDLVVEHVGHATQLVVFSENRFGSATASSIEDGAAAAFAAVEQAAPDALIVVVAPRAAPTGSADPGPEVRAALRAATTSAEVAVTYVDPVAEEWPTGARPQQVADLVFADIAPVVEALARSGAFE